MHRQCIDHYLCSMLESVAYMIAVLGNSGTGYKLVNMDLLLYSIVTSLLYFRSLCIYDYICVSNNGNVPTCNTFNITSSFSNSCDI